MVDDAWPEMVEGWELARSHGRETYRKRLANNVTVFAIWESAAGLGRVKARVGSAGLGRELTCSRTDFRDRESFWTAAWCVVEMAANLPLFDGESASPAGSVVHERVAGSVEVAEDGLTFTLVSGRTVTVVLSGEQVVGLARELQLASRVRA
ncbi:hypothetical protein EIL87_01150 [Saccharopolyspora rhizosphaerae]|uniref:Uncharacterized protein n=1 Tax=Saccharopolyspora rhizosphaerae TaxID=2492662 RepID=A0A3R8PB63_9PSEU|nr:hypothetical protein [Saccharopolyspora rhizosphaerae]RRO20529.1 hypothetical protein EIL87_01150 [Saccharopolyspora rhizosphaerae]